MKSPETSNTLIQCPECGELTYPYVIPHSSTATVTLRCNNCLSRIGEGKGTEDERFLIHMFNTEHAKRLLLERDLKNIHSSVEYKLKMNGLL